MNIKSAESISRESSVKDFFMLLKPRVMTLVVFTGICGMIMAPGFGAMHPFLVVIAVLALAVGAGAAGAMNMWYDRDIDAIMTRTRGRPIPMGRIAPDDALGFALILSFLAVMMMGLVTNWVAAGLLAFANLFYSVFYTMILKRLTAQNIVIGGAAGAFPPMIGWAAVTGDITPYPVIMFLIIFFWTPPHFWALSLFANEDYKRAGIPMLTVTHGRKATKVQIMIYSIILALVSSAPYFMRYEGLWYLGSAMILNGIFFAGAISVYKEPEDSTIHAKKLFGYSILYLFLIFIALVVF